MPTATLPTRSYTVNRITRAGIPPRAARITASRANSPMPAASWTSSHDHLILGDGPEGRFLSLYETAPHDFGG